MGQIRNLGAETFVFSVVQTGIYLKQGEVYSTPVLTEDNLALIQAARHVVIEGSFDIVKSGYFGFTVLRHVEFPVLAVPEKEKPEAEKKFEGAKAEFFEALKQREPKVEDAPVPVPAEEILAEVAEDVPMTEAEIYEQFGNAESEAEFVKAMVDGFKKATLVEMCEAHDIVALGNKEALARALFENYLISK